MKIRTSRRSGFTYMTVIITMIIVGLTLAAYMKLVGVQHQLTARSQTWNRSVPVIEAGVEEAIAHLNKNGAPDIAGVFKPAGLAADGWTGNSTIGWTKNGQIGNDYYTVFIAPWNGTTGLTASNFPSIYSTGIVEQLPAYALNSRGGFFVADVLDDIVSSGRFSKRVVACTTTNVPTFTKALVAKKGIDLAGQGVRTDSFDSGDPNYHDGFGHYTNSPGKWKTNGDIASNDTVTNAISGGNANIFGKVATGPFGTIDLGQGMVGDVAWQGNNANKGKIQPGWSSDDMNMEFPSVAVPSVSWSSLTLGTGGFTTNGVTYTTTINGSTSQTNPTYYTLIPGTTFTGKIYVKGHACLLVQLGKIAFTGQDVIKIAPGGSLKLYGDCVTTDLGGNGVANDGLCTQFYYFGTDRNTSLSFSGNAAFTGVVYAPNAALTMGGGGSNEIDFSGAAIARTIKMNGHFNFHYDENLKKIGLYRGFVITSWNEK